MSKNGWIETVGDLIEELMRHPLDARVLGTWEGTLRNLSVYRTPSGDLLVDADYQSYRKRWESGDPGYTKDREHCDKVLEYAPQPWPVEFD